MTPAVARHPSEIIREELEARGWRVQDLCLAADCDTLVGRLSWDWYLALEPEIHGAESLVLGPVMAAQLAKAFGTSPEVWLNLERAWLDTLAPPAAPGVS